MRPASHSSVSVADLWVAHVLGCVDSLCFLWLIDCPQQQARPRDVGVSESLASIESQRVARPASHAPARDAPRERARVRTIAAIAEKDGVRAAAVAAARIHHHP